MTNTFDPRTERLPGCQLKKLMYSMNIYIASLVS